MSPELYEKVQLPPKTEHESESDSESVTSSSDREASNPSKTLHMRGPWLRKQRLLRIWRFGRKAGVMKAISAKRRRMALGPGTVGAAPSGNQGGKG